MTLLAVSAALLAALVIIETRVEAPLMPLRIFASKTLTGANAVSVPRSPSPAWLRSR